MKIVSIMQTESPTAQFLYQWYWKPKKVKIPRKQMIDTANIRPYIQFF